MSHSRFVVGIDLGTTNCALAYFDTGAGDEPSLQNLKIPQVTQPGVVEDRPLLPSFCTCQGPTNSPRGA
jgi:molecular chaperone DnaK (HSP70)